MKKSCLLSSIFMVCCVPGLFAQKEIEGHYGKTGQDVAYAAAATNDGGYIMAGLTKSGIDSNGSIIVIKTNDKADTMWSLLVLGPNLQGGNSVMQTADGGYMVSGHTEDFNAIDCDAYLMKLDPNGKFLWLTHFGGFYDDISEDAVELPGGGYVFAGITESFGNNDTSQRRHVYFGKTTASGDSVWTKFYAGPGTEYANSLISRPSGGFFAVGFSNSWGNGEDDAWLLCLDNNGDTLWTRFNRNLGDSRYLRIIPTLDNGYMIAGYTTLTATGNSVGYAIKLDINGNELWEKTYSDPTRKIVFTGVAQLPNGNYMFTGTAYPTDTTGNVYILTTDQNGNTTGVTECGGINSSSNAIAVQGNNSYLVAGMAAKYGDPQGDLYYMEMDNNVAGVPLVTISEPHIYPNPVSNQSLIIILPESEANQTITMNVTSLAGEQALGMNNILAKDIVINRNTLCTGMYLYTITCKDGKVYNGKFVVE